MPQIWASHPPPPPPKLVVKPLTHHHLPLEGLNEVFSTTLSTWQEVGVLVLGDSGHPLSLSLFPLLSDPRSHSLCPDEGVSSVESSSPSLVLIECGLSFNRPDLNTYCESNWVPGTVDSNMTEQNLALTLRCSQGFWWTECNWIYEGSLLPTMWKSEDSKDTPSISNYPATWITRLLRPSGLTSATKCNHLL